VPVRAVIDTNIWVSSFLNPSGSPAMLRKAFEEGVFHVIISEAIIEDRRRGTGILPVITGWKPVPLEGTSPSPTINKICIFGIKRKQ